MSQDNELSALGPLRTECPAVDVKDSLPEYVEKWATIHAEYIDGREVKVCSATVELTKDWYTMEMDKLSIVNGAGYFKWLQENCTGFFRASLITLRFSHREDMFMFMIRFKLGEGQENE